MASTTTSAAVESHTADRVPGTATGVQEAPATLLYPELGGKHPLDSLTPDEIVAVSLAVRAYATQKGVRAFKFITSNIVPPPKRTVLAILGIPEQVGQAPQQLKAKWVRRAETDFIDIVTGDAYNARLALSASDPKWSVTALTKLPTGTQPQISVEELAQAEEIVRSSPLIHALMEEIGLKKENIACDGWSIGFDDRFGVGRRVQQALMFARFGEHENLYAHPLDFIPVIDSNTHEVLHIDFPAHRSPTTGTLSLPTTLPTSLPSTPYSANALPSSMEQANRPRVPVPELKFDFLPDLRSKEVDEGREDGNIGAGKKYQERVVKPLHVIQPEGVSFTMDGNVLEWQKWKMHIAFNHREGIVISTVTYADDGLLRPVFYRLSLAEMVVPYGAPEFPHPRKFAFDAGEYGMGTMANDLSLGCDCVGTIHYLPGCFVGNDGSAITIKHAICIHEEDDGILWKHSDYRTGGRSFAARSRRLVVSMCCTLANYEYIWNFRFYQDGTTEFEVRLTGILQVYPTATDEPTPFGTLVAPRVNAHYHQHLFSLRVDPMIDGLSNSILESDVVPIHTLKDDHGMGSEANWAGNAFTTTQRIVSKSGGLEYSYEKDRRWRIVNPSSSPHYASGALPGYGIQARGALATLLAHPQSYVQKRAGFTSCPAWVIKDRDVDEGEGEGEGNGGRVYPSGKYVPQTREVPEEGIERWAAEGANVEGEDIVLFLTLGTNHIPRPEDWPVMPAEHLNVMFKPQNFFRVNPGMDVAAADDRGKSCNAFPPSDNGVGRTENGVDEKTDAKEDAKKGCCAQ